MAVAFYRVDSRQWLSTVSSALAVRHRRVGGAYCAQHGRAPKGLIRQSIGAPYWPISLCPALFKGKGHDGVMRRPSALVRASRPRALSSRFSGGMAAV